MSISNHTGSAESTINRAASGAHDAVDKVAGATTDAAAAIGEKGEQLKRSQEKWVMELREYVSANPVTALGIAVAGGYVLSRLLSAR